MTDNRKLAEHKEHQAYEVPLTELLRDIPKDFRVVLPCQWSDDGRETGHRFIPVGYLMHRAADKLDAAGSERNEVLKDIVAGDAFRNTLLARADARTVGGNYPLWHGWAIMDAFLAGAAFARSKPPTSIRALKNADPQGVTGQTTGIPDEPAHSGAGPAESAPNAAAGSGGSVTMSPPIIFSRAETASGGSGSGGQERVLDKCAQIGGTEFCVGIKWSTVIGGVKQGGDWFNAEQPSISRMSGSKSSARKAASATIAKIPLTLARYIARTYHP